MSDASPVLTELLADAESRTPWVPDDTKSGARFEQVVIGGERFVLKYQDPRDDWLLRASGDPGLSYVRLWESGILDRLPPVIDHAVVAAAFDGTVGMVLLRDVGDALLQADAPFTPAQHARFIDHMAALHATFWAWRDDVGLTPLERRYLMFSPGVAAAEVAGGKAGIVPQAMVEGWQRLPDVSPAMADAVLPLLADPRPLVAGLARLPRTLVHGDWKAANLGTHPDGRTVLLDFGEAPGEASPLADLSWYLALNAALLPEPKDGVLESYRRSLEGCGVSTTAWWEDAVALELLGCMLQFGWEKALGGAGDELSWWEEWVRRGTRCLERFSTST
jgi:Phosphotransferase enzyme family